MNKIALVNKNTKKNIAQVIDENSVLWREFTKDFTYEQKKIVENEIRYYDVVIDLRDARMKLGLTQEELAQKANLPRTTITKVESGSYNPTLQTLVAIAGALDKKLEISLV